MALTSGYAVALPVFASVPAPCGSYMIEGEVCGSAFALGGEYMLTARHVLVEASARGYQAVVGLKAPDGFWKAARVVQSEELDADIALLRVEFLVAGSDAWFNRFRWREPPLEPFELVRVVGYGYGIHRVDERQSVVVRGFQGHVVSLLNEFKPIGWSGPAFPAYELSFSTPRGLSGAPVLNSQGAVFIHGVVIGNSESRMLVFRFEERLTEGSVASTLEQYEALTLGIAVAAKTVLRQTSTLLKKTLREHLIEHGLLD
jgi:hypothetical protein